MLFSFEKYENLLTLETMISVDSNYEHYVPKEPFSQNKINLNNKIIKTENNFLGVKITGKFIPTNKFIELQYKKIDEVDYEISKEVKKYETWSEDSQKKYFKTNNIEKPLSFFEKIKSNSFLYQNHLRDIEKINLIKNSNNDLKTFKENCKDISFFNISYFTDLYKNKKVLKINLIIEDPTYWDKRRNRFTINFYYDITNTSFEDMKKILENKKNELFIKDRNNNKYIDFNYFL